MFDTVFTLCGHVKTEDKYQKSGSATFTALLTPITDEISRNLDTS